MSTGVDKYVQKYQDAKRGESLQHGSEKDESDSDSLLELLEQLENDDEVATRYKEDRLQQLKKEVSSIDRASSMLGDKLGSVTFTENEKELMNSVSRADAALVHFYQPTFQRCIAMNKILSKIAEKHMALHVVCIPAEKAPFLVSKLQIKILPFVVIYKNGQEIDRIVGFEGIGQDTVSYDSLETKLLLCGAINRKTKEVIRGTTIRKHEESDDDWY